MPGLHYGLAIFAVLSLAFVGNMLLLQPAPLRVVVDASPPRAAEARSDAIAGLIRASEAERM